VNTHAKPQKPLGRRSYGSIPHLLGSRRGPGDHGVNEGQHRICTERCRRGDTIIIQEKLDGSNVGVAKIDGEVVPITRAGYRAEDSPYVMHHRFAEWVYVRNALLRDVLNEGERLCGEWLAQAHGTIYDLSNRHPFVGFDIFDAKNQRLPYHDFAFRIDLYGKGEFSVPPWLYMGEKAVSLDTALGMLGDTGQYGAKEPAEGLVYRVEHKGVVDFLAKYVRPEKVDGKYLDQDVWLWEESK